MTFITSLAKSLVQFHKKEQQLHALKRWRNGIFFLLVLSAYTTLLPWWSSNQKFKAYAAAEIYPITSQLPELKFSDKSLDIKESQDISHPLTKELYLHISTENKPSTKAPFIITPDWLSIKINNQSHQLNFADLNDLDQKKVDPSIYDELLQLAPWIVYLSVFFTLFFNTALQCLFLTTLFYFLNKKTFEPRFLNLLKLSILASVPFSVTYALCLFYHISPFLSILLPSLGHFIFFFRSLPTLLEYQDAQVNS